MNLLYCQSDYSRISKYRISTAIIKTGNKLVVEKKAVSKEASTHIQNIINNYQQLVISFPQLLLPKLLNTDAHSLQYEFISEPSFKIIIERALFNQDYKETLSTILLFLNLFNSLPSNSVPDSKITPFFKYFSIPIIENYSISPLEIIQPGLLDFTFGNLIISKTKTYYFVDHEWIYNFGVPKNFILWRALYNLLVKLQPIIQASISRNFPSYQLSDHLQCPISWWDLFNFSVADFKLYAEWESHIEYFFTNRFFNTNDLIYKNVNDHSKFIINSQRQDVSFDLLSYLKLNSANRTTLIKQINDIENEIYVLKNNLNIITSSKFYKSLNVIKKIMHFIT